MTGEPRGLGQLVAALTQQWKILLASTAISATLMFAFSATHTDVYAATSQLELVDLTTDAIFSDRVSVRDLERVRQTQIAVVQSRPLREDMERALGEDGDSITSVSARGLGATDVILVTVRANDAEVAARGADILSERYIATRAARSVAELTERTTELEARVDAMDADVAALDAELATMSTDDPRIAVVLADRSIVVERQRELRSLSDQFQIESALRQASARIVEPAEIPEDPVAPTPVRDAGLLGFIVLSLTSLGILTRDQLDKRIRSVEDLKQIPGLPPVLAVIPSLKSLDVRNPPAELLELFRDVRTSVDFVSTEHDVRTLLIASPDEGVGKTTTTSLLGQVMAASGKHVVVVDGDLRRPRLHTTYGVDAKPGLTGVLAGRAVLSEALHTVPVTRKRSLEVLPAGHAPVNAADVLASRRFADLMRQLRDRRDFVLVDSPPSSAVADPILLSRCTDAAIVLVRLGRTRRDTLELLLQRLQASNSMVAGVIVTFAPESDLQSSYAGYFDDQTGEISDPDLEDALLPREPNARRKLRARAAEKS